MPLSQLLFYFIVLPIVYTALVVILISAVGSIMKQVKYAEYDARIAYDQCKAKIGQEAAEKYKASYAVAE